MTKQPRRPDIVTGTPADPFYALAASATRQARCLQGEHEEETVTLKRVVYAGTPKRRLESGERYCIYCGVVTGSTQ